MSNPIPETSSLKQVTIFTDGAAVPNPGAGGYGVVLRFGRHVKELSGGFIHTTNNRMELMAVIVGLEALKERCKVHLYSDSQYVVNAITSGSALRWRSAGWAKVKNGDLWERLLSAYDRHEVITTWVKGHSGIEDNERCDALAMDACQRADLPSDPGFMDRTIDERAPSSPPGTAAPLAKGKVAREGQACRKCGTAVVKKTPKKKTIKEGQTYYFAWYLYCPSCKNMYLVEDAKINVIPSTDRPQENAGDAASLFGTDPNNIIGD